MAELIRVYIASNERWAMQEPVIEYSIRTNTKADVEINIIRPLDHGMQETGCTSFTNVRWAVPELAGHAGFAIYLDVDMLVLGDIVELWSYKQPGRFVCLADGSTEVMVMDCTQRMPPLAQLHQYKKWSLIEKAQPYLRPRIPLEWNCKDGVDLSTKLIHFTDLSRQPWFTPERDDRATQILRRYESDCAASA